MEINLVQAQDYLNDVLKKDLSIQDSMKDLISFCAEASPEDKKSWDFLLKRNYEEEIYQCKRWFEELLDKYPINDENIDVFWFGMFNIEDNDEVCGLYIAGLEYEDSDTININGSPSYLPRKYMSSDLLHCLYTFTTQSGKWAFEVGEFLLCIGYSALLIKTVCQDINISPLLKEKAHCPVLVGVDTQEYTYLGKLSKEGWLP